MAKKEHWKPEPEEHDFPAAHDFLSLVLPGRVTVGVVAELRSAPLVSRKAKDLLRASLAAVGIAWVLRGRPSLAANAAAQGDLDDHELRSRR